MTSSHLTPDGAIHHPRRASYLAVSFDCYGTLIDWDTGISDALGPWAAHNGCAVSVSRLVTRFAAEQRALQAERPARPYPEVLAEAFRRAAFAFGVTVADAEAADFAAGIGAWPAFPDTLDALRRLKAAGLHLAVLSNVDSASFAATHDRLDRLADTVVVAGDVGAYKPDPRMFEALLVRLADKGIARNRVLHVAQSRYHDIAPARAIGLDAIWIDRRRGRSGGGVTVEAPPVPDVIAHDSLASFVGAFL